MKLKTKFFSRNADWNTSRFTSRFLFRAVACPLLAGVSLCAFQDDGYAQSVSRNNLLRGTIATNSTNSNTIGTSGDIVDPTITASIPLSEQPVQLNLATGSLPALGSVHNDDDVISLRENPNVQPEQAGTVAQIESDPFAAPGFRLGSSIATLTLEQSLGASTNATQTTGGDSGYFSQTNIAFNLLSDWSRHELALNADGSFRKYLDNVEADRPTFGLGANLRLDLTDGYTNTWGATYNYDTEDLTSSRLGSDVTTRPGIHTARATSEIARTDRRIGLSLRGIIERDTYEDAVTTTGVLNQEDRNNNTYLLRARVGYDNGAIIQPFVEGGGGVTRYDEEFDRNGDQRNSTTYFMRAGIVLDIEEKLDGEIAFGYVAESYDQGSLSNLEGFTVDGQLNWSPTRETTISANVSTGLNGATSAGNNGSIIYSGGLVATHQLTNRWSINLNTSFNIDYDDEFDSRDATYTIGTGARYWMSRYMAISADLDHRIYQSGDGNSDYDETVAMLGIVLQR